MLRQHLLVRHVVGHLAQPVHVVGEGDQPGLDLVVGEHAEGVAHHGGARDLAEGADMRQAGGAVAGLEDHLVLRLALQPRDDLARLLERPGVRLLGELAQRGGGFGDGHRALRARPLHRTAPGGVNRARDRSGAQRCGCGGGAVRERRASRRPLAEDAERDRARHVLREAGVAGLGALEFVREQAAAAALGLRQQPLRLVAAHDHHVLLAPRSCAATRAPAR